MPPSSQDPKPKRLYFKSYLAFVKNSVGSNLFRNFYVSTDEKGEFDALDDGDNSCAFFVSATLTIFKKLSGIHGTIDSTLDDLVKSGWQEVEGAQAGDVIVWEKQQFDDGLKAHVGFCIGDGQAVSTSQSQKTPVVHSQTFDGRRKIEKIFRMEKWDDA